MYYNVVYSEVDIRFLNSNWVSDSEKKNANHGFENYMFASHNLIILKGRKLLDNLTPIATLLENKSKLLTEKI